MSTPYLTPDETALPNEDWRDNIRYEVGYLHGLPNRRGGFLPEVKRFDGRWGVKDYPNPEIEYIFTSEKIALAVAYAYYSKTKYTKEAFMSLLNPRHLADVLEALSPDAKLIWLSQNYYFDIYEGTGGWNNRPHGGPMLGSQIPFDEVWVRVATRVSNELLGPGRRAVDDVPSSVGAVAVPGGESSLPVVKPVEHSKVLLLL